MKVWSPAESDDYNLHKPKSLSLDIHPPIQYSSIDHKCKRTFFLKMFINIAEFCPTMKIGKSNPEYNNYIINAETHPSLSFNVKTRLSSHMGKKHLATNNNVRICRYRCYPITKLSFLFHFSFPTFCFFYIKKKKLK